jgi:hypothetical protein
MYNQFIRNASRPLSSKLHNYGRRTINRNLRLRPSITPKRYTDIPINRYKLYKNLADGVTCTMIISAPIYLFYKMMQIGSRDE